jgi:hypothetical protein
LLTTLGPHSSTSSGEHRKTSELSDKEIAQMLPDTISEEDVKKERQRLAKGKT